MDVTSVDNIRKQLADIDLSNNPKAERARMVVESILDTAETIQKAAKAIPKYKLPRIAIIARRRKAFGMAQMMIAAYMGRAWAYQIASQPIPKYPNGRITSGLAIIGDNGREIIGQDDISKIVSKN